MHADLNPFRVALVRNHDSCENTRQLKEVQQRAGALPHLGLAYIQGALVRAGFRTRLLDAQVLRLDSSQLREALREFSPSLVGVTTMTPGLPGAIEACKIAKDIGAQVVLGGPHTEAFGPENLCHSCIDYVGVGEGCTIMTQLANRLSNGESTSDLNGVISRDQQNPPAPMLPLQQIGWPLRSPEIVANSYSIMAKRPFATMISSRGCPFKCSFCFKQAVDQFSVFRPAEDVVDEMQMLVEKHGVREIMFYDDVFTMRRDRVFEICDLIQSRGLKVRWEAPTRVDLVPPKLLVAMSNAGCVRLRFGIEHGSPEVLQRMHKEADIDVVRAAVSNAVKSGIEAFGYFIVGYLAETRQQFEETIALATSLDLAYASFYTAVPLPGTKLYEESEACGAVKKGYWRRFVEGHWDEPIGFLVPHAEERAREAYRRFYFRRKKVPMIARHMLRTGQWRRTLSGLASLARSVSNELRDF